MTAAPTAPLDTYKLRAMELRGGNDAASDRLTLSGFDAYLYSRPHRGAPRGGDLNFVSSCAMGHIIRFTLADLAGHGEEAGDLALRLRALLRKHINTPNPTKLAAALNKELGRLSEGGRFATAVITTYFAPTDHLIVCNAGHPRPLLYHAPVGPRPGFWELFDQASPSVLSPERSRQTGISNLPLGVVRGVTYPQFATRLFPGDIFISYTDALIEAAGPDGRELGEEGLLETARRLDLTGPPPAEQIGKSILEAVAAHSGGRDLNDDATLLVLCHNGSDPPDGPWPRLVALARVVGLVH